MRAKCEVWGSKPGCKAVVTTYRNAVDNFGCSPYLESQHDVCTCGR
jgi:hypothetical protein